LPEWRVSARPPCFRGDTDVAGLGVPARNDIECMLRQSFRALDHGMYEEARAAAKTVLLAAKATADIHLEAKALACLAHCDRVTQRLRRSSETARRAVQLFQRVGDAEGETMALNTLSHACMLLGRMDESVEAAMLSVTLCDVTKPTPTTVVAHNCLGMAYCWSGHFERANASLETAVHLAARCERPMSPYQPKLNQLWVEAARLADERYQTGIMGDLRRMGGIVRECRRLERSGEELTFMPGMLPIARTISVSMKGLYSAWQGELENTRIYADRAIGSLGATETWLDALVRWVLAELAWAQGDWVAAEAALVEMRTCAIGVEHEQLACLAQLLLIQVFELQGKTEMAKLEARLLRSRERRMSAESLSGREGQVKWQLGARQSERHLEQALLASKQFERWSFEDALTGIANRRRFEQALAERLPASVADGRPLTVAMVDLDQFKAVNDTHSHQVGDRVLKTVASVLVSSVRENDLAARLAGDEFVVLFSDADAGAAGEICERIRRAVADFDWNSIARGLRVSVSIGVSQAVEGDSVESIMHRSDKSMYTVKPGWVPTNLSELDG
jgi:diguanylate cyclase (GGDEF)-like protein